jgi:drug/metabolite transporter (DMT)-like permease
MFAWFVLFLLGAIWGASYLFIKVGVAEIPPFTFVEVRTLLATLVLLIALRIRGESLPRTLREWRPLIAVGFLNSIIPYTLITWGEKSIASGLAAILTSMVPLFTVIFAHYVTHDERLTAAKAIGVSVGFFGVIILSLPQLRGGIQAEFFGELAVVVASASYACATLIARKFLRGVSYVVASIGQLGVSAIVLLPLSLIFDNPFSLRPSLAALGSLTTLALLGTAFALFLYFWLIENTGATRATLVTYIIPVMAVMWGAVILHEPIEWEAIIGLALILGGIGLVTGLAKAAPKISPHQRREIMEEG